MPRLVKGGKYVFGWSVINKDGLIIIPEDARKEYKLNVGERVILMPGSKTSGGFIIARKTLLERSRLSNILTQNTDLNQFRINEGHIVKIGSRNMCWVTIRENGRLLLLPDILEAYEIKTDDYLLAVRGSYLGLGMVVKGLLVEEARQHHEIITFRL
jgi:bifunctional DNA-binding transcriptional regulator/antitoxin component of YhaV-PrlF toxin-antitoxin module